MADKFSTVEGRYAFSDFLTKPGVMLQLGSHKVHHNLVRPTPSLSSDAFQGSFQVWSEGDFHSHDSTSTCIDL
jgi:hypothetical protein